MNENHITLNPSQRQRLLVTCKHIDKLLGDIEETMNAAASKSVFPNYVGDITPLQRKTIEDYIARRLTFSLLLILNLFVCWIIALVGVLSILKVALVGGGAF